MELLQLHYFQTVARMEHMTKAAKELRIAQPALSKTIARLEEDLGVQLFDRQNRQIKLNSFRKAFLKSVDTALSALEEGKRGVGFGRYGAGQHPHCNDSTAPAVQSIGSFPCAIS